jgi:hypothetical protein
MGKDIEKVSEISLQGLIVLPPPWRLLLLRAIQAVSPAIRYHREIR